MKIERHTVGNVASLARLELNDAEFKRMWEQLDNILSYIDKLNEIDTGGVEPMAQVLAESRPDVSLREDARIPSLPHQEAVQAAPDADEAFVKVPKVIER